MQSIIQSKSYKVAESYRQSQKLKGFNLSLFRILLNSHNRVIKLEGKQKMYGKIQPYWDVISVKEGKLDYYYSYAPVNLGEYNKLQADLLLKGDQHMSVDLVVRSFIEERGLYNT